MRRASASAARCRCSRTSSWKIRGASMETSPCEAPPERLRRFPLSNSLREGGGRHPRCGAALPRCPSLWSRRLLTVLAKRSEEHTSELQSPCNLVCRLLLEKKKHRDIRCDL